MRGNIFVAIIFAIAIIAGGLILGRAYNYKFKTHNTVSIAGSANYNFTADLIVWSASFNRTSMDIKEAYNTLKADAKQINEYLAAHGISAAEIVFSSINIDKQYDNTYNENGRLTGTVFKGYKLRQMVKVESKKIDSVEKISREITELLQSGVELSSDEPTYYYTKLSDLKLDLLAKASVDAYNRANIIAKNAHGHLGHLRRANMGVFQITGQYSNESYTYSGAYNTSSKNKTANVIVRMEYELD